MNSSPQNILKIFLASLTKDNYSILGYVTILYTFAIVFFACTEGLDFEYGTYTILRWLVMLFAGWTTYKVYRKDSKSRFSLLFASIAILFNPIFKITLEEGLWLWIDTAIAIIFLVWLVAPEIPAIKNCFSNRANSKDSALDSVFSQDSFSFVKGFFASTGIFVVVTGLKIDKNERTSIKIFVPELTFYILALFINTIRSKYGKKFEGEIGAFKGLLCKQINYSSKKYFQTTYDEDYISNVIENRCKILFNDTDMEVRNFNFLNICNTEIKAYENKRNGKHFEIIQDVNAMRITPGNPLDMMLLPTAYKSGFVDKGLDSLTEVLNDLTKLDIEVTIR